MKSAPLVIGLGEALFDMFGDEVRLGGAPLNVAVHAHQLGANGVVVSRVGQDDLGQRVIDELKQRGMSVEHIQTDPDRPTGTVLVDVNEQGEPTFDIVANVAWDMLQFDPDMESLARRADAVCFGSLAQRDGQARNTIYRFVEAAQRAVRLFDVNLRQDYYDRRILTRSCEIANAVKLNAKELGVLSDLFSLGANPDEAAKKLIAQFGLKWLALTRGAEGTAVYTASAKHEAQPVPLSSSDGDAVGAGDATSAALLIGVLRRWPWDRTLHLANTLGAHVASQKGACPSVTDAIKAMVA